MAEQTADTSDDQTQTDANGPPKPASGRPGFLALGSTVAVVAVLVALTVGVYALFRSGSWEGGGTEEPDRQQLDLTAHMDVPPELLAYVERHRIDLALQSPKAIAVAPNGAIYVAGDASIEVLHPDGSSRVTGLDGPPTCLAVGSGRAGESGRVYVGIGRRIVVMDEAGELLQQWPEADAKSLLTDIAVAGNDIFVADAGQRAVLRYSPDGKLIGTIGRADPDRQMPGFVIPSPYFDVAIATGEVVQIVNPGMRRVEAYSFDGELQSFWGRAGSAVTDFFGCCNPAHLALLPDGRFVTSEKGIPRIKIYSATGTLLHVVAGPRQLGVPAAALGDARGNQEERVFDVAVNGAENVLVLDARNRQVIVFELRGQATEAKS